MQFPRTMKNGKFEMISSLEEAVLASIRDILETPKGTRIMRPEYGSRLFELLDRPFTSQTKLDIIYEAITSIARWEPRIKLIRVRILSLEKGKIQFEIIFKLKNELLTKTLEVYRAG